MITRIEAYRYRCFENLDIALGAYNVLAGPNGSGKSTLLDIPRLIGDIASVENAATAFVSGQRGEEWARARSLSELVFKEHGNAFQLVLEARLPSEVSGRVLELASPDVRNDPERHPTHLRYEIGFEIFNKTELQIGVEHLFLFSDKHAPPHGQNLVGQRENLKHVMRVISRADGKVRYRPEGGKASDKAQEASVEPFRAAVSKQPFDTAQFPSLTWFQHFVSRETLCYRPDWRKLRTPCPPGMKTGLMASAWNLPWLVLALKDQDDKDRQRTEAFTEGDLSQAKPFYPRIADWVAHLQTALPQIEAVSAGTNPGDSHAYLELTYKGGHIVRSSGLSEGTDNILAFTVLPFLLDRPQSVVVEEPENGVHPQGIHTVLEALRQVKGSQVWVSTHSPIVVANTELPELVLLRQSEDGAATCILGSQHPFAGQWKAGVDLGHLYAAGILS